jgi:hypothetical protein
MEACLEGVRSCRKRMTDCQILSVASPEKSKASPEGMKTMTDTFNENSDKLEAMGLEANT